MQTMNLSRNERRQRIAKAAKLYGIKGETALIIHQAYDALFHKRLEEVVKLIGPISKSYPKNKHSWIILGGAALEKIEGSTARVFFEQARALAPKDPVILGGIAKAYVLEAEVEPATQMMEQAFAAGNIDKGLINLYLELMIRFGRSLKAADILGTTVKKLHDAELCYRLATIYTDADEPNKAIPWFKKAYQLDPKPETHQIGRLRGLLFSRKFEDIEAEVQKLLETVKNTDEVIILYMMALRLVGNYDAVRTYADTYEFKDPKAYAIARSLMANVYQDIEDWARVEAAYVEAMHIAGEPGKISKALGVYKYRERDFQDGFPFYSDRFPAQNRKHIPVENASIKNLKQLNRIYLMGEQGIGDQLALLNSLKVAPINTEQTTITYISDKRLGPLLENNSLCVDFISQDVFFAAPRSIQPNEFVYVGDLSQYLDRKSLTSLNGAYLTPNKARKTYLTEKYKAKARGRPIIGVAWNSASLIGHMRSLPLADLLSCIKEEAFIVNLQYGATQSEIKQARKERPDLEIYNDPEINQMNDLEGFAAQISSLDKVITIDNTTAHICGALGHQNTHVLIPLGSECMWYWGREGTLDPWYGNLRLHRQTKLRDWGIPIESVRAT